MRWEGEEASENVEDRRNISTPVLAGGGGLATLLIVGLIWVLGGDPRAAMQALQGQPGGQQPAAEGEHGAPQDAEGRFVAVVLRDTERVWEDLFRQKGRAYTNPTLVLFRGRVNSACGVEGAATGPFYCPLDQKLYIDLSFYREMKDNLGAPGDFAQAYVIAHEVGHHVQNLLGISDSVRARQERASREEANELSVRLELQADFFAGVWAHHAEEKYKILEEGDIEEALNAASAIGDDRLQMKSQGVVVPESFTHGTSKQRVRWFTRGLKTGDMSQGDTFKVPYQSL